MKTYLTHLNEQAINEKLILINNGKKYGQIVFLAGGAASGKGFASANFLNNADFKTRDVDEWKLAFLKLAKYKSKYKELKNLNLKNADDVGALHDFVDKLGIKDKTLNVLLNDAKNPKTLPNIIFDVTLKDTKSMNKTIPRLLEVGYKEENIHLVWVLSKYEVAVQANQDRDRVVPADILLNTHIGAAKTMWDVIGKRNIPKSLNGGVYVILNNRENTIFFKGNEKKDYRSDNDKKPKVGTRTNTGQKFSSDPRSKGKTVFTIKDFKYLTFKEPRKPAKKSIEIQTQLYRWVIDNMPNVRSKEIFD